MFLDSVWWFRVILEGVVFLIGVPGNLFIIQVYASKKSKVTPHVFIIGLAVADFSVCLLRAITLLQLFPPLDNLSATSQFFCRVPPSIDIWPKYTSILLTAAVAVDRYMAICRPHRRRMTVRGARRAVYASFAVSVVFTLSYLFIYGVAELPDGSTACQFIVPITVVTAEFVILLLSFLISLAINLVLYVKVYRTVSRMAKIRPGNTVQRRALRGQTSVFRDNSTARAEGVTPNQLMAAISRKTNLQIRQDESGEGPDVPAKSDQPHLGARTSTNLPRPETAWSADHEPMKELPILKLPIEPNGPSTSSINNSSSHSAIPLTQAATVAAATDNDQANGPQFHKKTTLMLALSTIIFVVTLIPLLIILIVYPFLVPLLQNPGSRFLINVATYIHLVNNAANPVLYSCVNRRFREDMKRSLKKLCRPGCHFRD